MAKKKKGRRYRGRRSKRAAPKRDKAVPLGGLVGGLSVANELFLQRSPTMYAPVKYLPDGKYTEAVQALIVNAKDLSNYRDGVIGLLVSASPKLPLVGMVAKPVDKAIRRASKGKVSL